MSECACSCSYLGRTLAEATARHISSWHREDESDARTHRTPKALCAQYVKTHIPFRESPPQEPSVLSEDFRSP